MHTHRHIRRDVILDILVIALGVITLAITIWSYNHPSGTLLWIGHLTSGSGI